MNSLLMTLVAGGAFNLLVWLIIIILIVFVVLALLRRF